MKFTHLHVHSHYSLLDGLPKIDELILAARQNGMDALALTDHGVMYGAIEFYKKAKAAGIKPIVGEEVYVAPYGYQNKTRPEDKARRHLTLLAKNYEGYQNLILLTTKAHLEGFYYKPRIDRELLQHHAKGLIALSGCLNGEIAHAIMQHNQKLALQTALAYQDILGKGNFYLELQRHPKLKNQEMVNQALIDISQKTKIPLVATADAHYLHPDDQRAQETLVAINTNKEISDENRLSMKECDLSFASGEKITRLFEDIPQAIEATQMIQDACNLDIELGQLKLPAFPLEKGADISQFLSKLCKKGIERRFGIANNEIVKRLEYELSVIKKTGFAPYFLIIWDIVNWAKQNGIVVGPGRGSAAGSLVSYLLNITNLDPLKHGLLFERFLNPERVSPPDIDIDFTDTRRDEVIAYAKKRYGEDRVAQIITFGTLASRAGIRDVGRTLGHPYAFCDRLAKMIPFGLTLNKCLEEISEFRKMYDIDPKAREVIDLSRKLEGVARHASTHACGIVITPQPLTAYTPLQHASQNDQTIVTQYEMHSVDDLGLLKMDFLGLKNLTIIEHTLDIIKERRGKEIQLESIPEQDQQTFKLLQKAQSTGIFQLESEGIKRYLKELKPTSFEDITAMCALYRPGPMELIPLYIRRKHGKEKVRYIHPKLEPILGPTYAVGVYQEQMMQIARDLAGYTMPEADILRKAIGKKISSLLEEQKEKLINGMLKNGIEKRTAEAIWELFPPFARYGFNRCLTGDATITDSETGKIITLRELYQKRNNLFAIFSLEKDFKIHPRSIANVLYNGKKFVWKVMTKSGRTIKATANHPFLTPRGWQQLENIYKEEKIAVPRFIPQPTQPIRIKPYKIGLLGYLLAEGNFCHPHSFYFYSKSKAEVNDYLHFLESFENSQGKIDASKSTIAVYAKRKDLKKPSKAVEWIESLGLKYRKATEKFFPEFVYQLSQKNLALLIGKMFQGDGCINLKRKHAQIFYATSSSAIAQGLQHLLLRFGILSTIHEKKFKYRGGIKCGYTLTINRYDNIKKFIEAFGTYLVGKQALILNQIRIQHPILNGSVRPWAARGSYDIIPVSLVQNRMRTLIHARGLSFVGFARKAGISDRLFLEDRRKVGYLRETTTIIARELRDKSLSLLASSDIYWDEVKKIEPVGIEDTYDLTIDEVHNFIANDIFVHNSHAACYALIAYQTAYLKAHYALEFMTALLNSRQGDVERLAFFIEEARNMGIRVLPPDINESLVDFAPVGENTIRFGLKAIKHVGEPVVKFIIEERVTNGPYPTIAEFINRVQNQAFNKKTMEALIKSGAFDTLEERATLLENIDLLLRLGQEVKSSLRSGQSSLFGGISTPPLQLKAALGSGNPQQKLAWEKELLGLYVSGNPLEKYRHLFGQKLLPAVEVNERLINREVLVGGTIEAIKKITTRNGDPMVFIKIKDFTNVLEITLFPGIIKGMAREFKEGMIAIVQGRVELRQGSLQVIGRKVKTLT